MNVQNAILLRRRYVSYIFKLSSLYFKNFNGLLNSFTNIDICKIKDKELNFAKNRLLGLQESIKNDSESLISMANFNSKAMKETTSIKQNISKKINKNKKEIEDNYLEINDLYQEIILSNSSIMLNKLKEYEIFNKMQLLIHKNDEIFVNYCKDFKIKDLVNLQDRDVQLKRLLIIQKDLVLDIEKFNIKQTELKVKPTDISIKMKIKNFKTKIVNHCYTLDYYNELYKSSHFESINSQLDEIKNLKSYFSILEDGEHKNDLDFFSKIKNINLNSAMLIDITIDIKKMISIYNYIHYENSISLEKIISEREKVIKAAICLDVLTIKALRQWLEVDESGWYYQTKEFLLNHPLSSDLMNPHLID